MIALTVFRVAAYVRSHRVYQALLFMLALVAIAYGSRAPKGAETAVLTDAAVLMIPILAWSSRSLLDTEPDQQRAMSAISVGGRLRELGAGLLAAFGTTLALAALALGWGLAVGVSTIPASGGLAAVLALYGIAALAGVVLGALTSRVILRSPAISIIALLLGSLVMLVLSASPLYWLTIPVVSWMKAANAAELVARLPELAAISLAWCLLGLACYAWLRRTRPLKTRNGGSRRPGRVGAIRRRRAGRKRRRSPGPRVAHGHRNAVRLQPADELRLVRRPRGGPLEPGVGFSGIRLTWTGWPLRGRPSRSARHAWSLMSRISAYSMETRRRVGRRTPRPRRGPRRPASAC